MSRSIFFRMMAVTAVTLAALGGAPRLADACAGLIGSNGAVNLGRTSTLAAYHDGVEHYVTAFEFQGGGGQFGTLIPLPGTPTKVERGGGWTLQRLARETAPPRLELAFDAVAGASTKAEVLQQVRIDALDISDASGAADAVSAIATAVTSLGSAQGNIGSLQNRLTFAVSLAQSQVVSTRAAESRIRVANVAEESANMTRFNILSQSGIAALSQANQQSSSILSLLR